MSLTSYPSFQRAGYAVIRPATRAFLLMGIAMDATDDVRRFASGRRSVVIREANEVQGQSSVAELWQRSAAVAEESWRQVKAAMQWPDAALPTLASSHVPRDPGPHMLRLFYYPAGHAEHLVEHRDLGLLTVSVGVGPGLEVHDSARGWVDVGKETRPGDVVVMVGETLQDLSNGTLPACLHRVVGGAEPRTSAVFHLRMPAQAVVDSRLLTTPQTGTFLTPFRHTMHDFALGHLAGRESVNEEPADWPGAPILRHDGPLRHAALLAQLSRLRLNPPGAAASAMSRRLPGARRWAMLAPYYLPQRFHGSRRQSDDRRIGQAHLRDHLQQAWLLRGCRGGGGQGCH